MAVAHKKKRDLYFELVQAFPLRRLRADDELVEAIEIIDSLLDKGALSKPEQDYLDVLSDLVEKYEAAEHPMPPVSDAAMLRHVLEAKEVPQAEVARATGIDESTLSLVLAGKRNLSRSHIGKLAHYFGVQPGAFAFE
jgi:HTH-type transcriptional regulator/antitoxin HigA